MKRREFTKLTGLSIIAISTTGFISFNGENYVGDCETTSDILGPFYRPDSPVRENLVIKGMPGELVELSGKVRHKDCSTPYAKAKVELWHCSNDEVYDNESEEFRYRGTTYSDENGDYRFITQMPVPYDAGGGEIRPAHFHMMISAPGYQSLITQIYFEGDKYLDNDPSSSNPRAKNRILKLEKEGDTHKIVFDCNMNDKLKPTDAALNSLVGKYKNVENGEVSEFFTRDGDLWVKNEVFGKVYTYLGKNEFEYGGLPEGMYEKLYFELKPEGEILLKKSVSHGEGKEMVRTFLRI
ncbi:protocatechuate 3,4-dioxygenase beta subunit [Christiangramia gaetbulicola]|uniref:Protocatechuate 3,4-dioxygenase beta subunit n=1 Tax=Christiangramia gaetbulicola TaxID=703340 RepID=A0A2T6ALD1_9FLAO|nr:catechol 1,2-dioxygenase [Christiangramia gaetbulicola]PTX44628.1 protocatechuate 3,4-dioxygenase beta subunit [Christiangramia gaetbulicola]